MDFLIGSPHHVTVKSTFRVRLLPLDFLIRSSYDGSCSEFALTMPTRTHAHTFTVRCQGVVLAACSLHPLLCSRAYAGRVLPLETSPKVLDAKEQQPLETAAAVNQLPPPLVRSVVRKATCPHGCGFTYNQDAIFDHKSDCPKRHDKILSKVNFYRAADDIRGGKSGSDRHCQMMAKRRLEVDEKYQRALSLKAIGRMSADTFQLNAGSYNHCHGPELW